ncbi:ankyrin repeat domain-containing protein [Wolbachia endosymbiont (group A) of Cheilosia soror]|uniref:ankyrin repeat domain-containing protein n=1 Tax=Wolbachia endosymbiont (group A) of Cheilosia soror TaxID=2953995 RepID=UPI0021F8ADEC|nr:ankyrin repeat domain-containing protein [Wolbachia endosymbiont (group A) of Cheilosia soror]
MVESEFEEMLKEILQEINNNQDINKENVIDEVRDKLEKRFPFKINQDDIYSSDQYFQWEKNNFNVNHIFKEYESTGFGCKDRYSLLHLAVKNGYETLARFLIEIGANIDVKGISNMTPLHVAVGEQNLKMVKLLLANNANVNVRSELEMTPLHYAAWFGNVEIVELLLKKEANVNVQDQFYRRTPLHDAAKHGHTQVVEILLKKGADVNIRDREGKTPLDYAIHYNYKHPKLIELLLDYGADPSCIKHKAIKISAAVGAITTVVIPLMLAYATELSVLAIVGITAVSVLIAGSIVYGVICSAYGVTIGGKLREVSCSNVDGNKQTV